jgi:DegV family protein with EDD domain
MAIEYLDGIRLYRSITAGLKRVVSRQDYLNHINVYPVPDSDTGTNMAYTLLAIEEGIQDRIHSHIHCMSMAIADSALDGARGNSGAILAQFFVGFADALQDLPAIDTRQFAQAVKTAKDYAYEALVHPQEGTILTVMSDWAEILQSLSNKVDDFRSLTLTALEQARTSLAETPRKLEILAKAGVVDAGAQGFVDMLEGIQDYINDGTLTPASIARHREQEKKSAGTNDRYRFCTECMITGPAIPRRALQERLITHGGSLVLAGTKTKVKVHIHTNDPKGIFALCREFGHVTGEKADDMRQQQRDARQEDGSIAVIVDSGCDLPEEILESLNIHVIPVRLNFGDAHYVDKVTLTIDEFWEELATNPIHPKTSQPTPGDFRRQYQFLSTHYQSAVSLHLPANLSGTMQSALAAARNLNDFPIQVLDSKNGSIGMGLIAMRAAEAIRAGKDFETVIRITRQAIANTTIYIGLDTLEYVVKGGRVAPSKRKIADFLHINPILTFSEGGVTTLAKTFGRKRKVQKFKSFVESRFPKDRPFRVGLAHTLVEPLARQWETELVEQLGRERVIFTEVSPALGVHAGPGALVAALQILEDDLSNE